MEVLFGAASLQLHIPEASRLPEALVAQDSPAGEQQHIAWDSVKSTTERTVAFIDEKITYFLSVHLPGDTIASLIVDETSLTAEDVVKQFTTRVQRTMSASFLPQLQVPARTRQATAPQSSSQQLVAPQTPQQPTTPGTSEPLTPMPFPATRGGEEGYADLQGVIIWEGEVGPMPDPGAGSRMNGNSVPSGATGTKGRTGREWVRRVDDGWEIFWEGEVPVAYIRTQIQNPVLALTASITLRPDASSYRHHHSAVSIATRSNFSDSGSVDERDEDLGEDGDAAMVDIDLLGGLAGVSEAMPAARLGSTARQDLSVSAHSTSPMPLSAITPATAPSHDMPPPTARSGPARAVGSLPSHLLPVSTTLRKSYRRVMALSPGLRVRMRNLVLPQLIAPSQEQGAGDEHTDGEKRVVLCVEIENAPDTTSPTSAFAISRIDIEIGGKGGKATAALTCQPGPDPVFPLKLVPMEQYNLLYAVTIASANEEGGMEEDQAARAVMRNLGTGEMNRPVSITVVGRPYYPTAGEDIYPTKDFNSRWNCNLDLTTYYASQHSPLSPSAMGRNRLSRPIPPNAIVGDKRYSLASLLTGDKDEAAPAPVAPNSRPQSLMPSRRIVSGMSQKPLMPSQLVNQASNRFSTATTVATAASSEIENPGLLISVRLLSSDGSDAGSASSRTIKALEPFSIEVFVHNRTDSVRRFLLSTPSKGDGRIGEMLRGRRKDVPIMDDPGLRQLLNQHLASAPGVIPLESDVRCGPLLPGASLSARMRFMALREGVHSIEKLRVAGVGDEVDFTMSPVLDVVVA